MSTFHRIFDKADRRVADIAWAADDNNGLPDWFFDGEFYSVEINPVTDIVEWVPGCGPAPCWKETFSSFADDATLTSTLRVWLKENY